MDPQHEHRPPRIGVVLGAGVARGWSHIGVLKALDRLGIKIHAVSGASSGALVGASYATGRLGVLEDLAAGMTQRGMLRFLDVSLSRGGMIEGKWILDFMRDKIGDIRIEEARLRFGAVATAYGQGNEVWFTSGSIVDAVRASIALPGLLTPVWLRGRWMLDGAVSNPLPVALCRALGAEVIIAVNTSGDAAREARAVVELATTEEDAPDVGSSWLNWLSGGKGREAALPKRPGSIDVLGDAIFSMQGFVTRVRLAADPPSIVLTPSLSEIGIMDFHKGSAAIAAGEAAVKAAESRLLALTHTPPGAPATE
ncbi:patatin-like phospholipase family protein [Algicella marina]|uniref:PNPLA domain-containing protein n=1 Tax=Algicella marina TaxID=2683284 RepID=A0A6P1T1X6_9RHOB|nr:patatin-like phospholipase family protein [Algicella marina]QHQ34532.1 hypothetical protein GO499_04670 [Algicella marina]